LVHSLERIDLGPTAPGTTRTLRLHRFGAAGGRPKAFIQASLHAGETPAMLAAHHLLRLLLQAEVEGRITGEIVLLPYANPVGLSQHFMGEIAGRYDMAGSGNFNRAWPDLAAPLLGMIGERLTDDAAGNVALIRGEMRALVEALRPVKEVDRLRKALAFEACDADVVLDLHCDDESLLHLFLVPQSWPDGADLAAELGAHAVLLAEDSGGGSFDEAFSGPWLRLAAAFPDRPIPLPCFSTTVELRGFPDVNDALAEADAAALFRFLQRRGLIAGDPGPLPPLACDATRLDACDTMKAPAAGIVSYRAGLGRTVRKGEVVADLIDPAADDPEAGRSTLVAGTDGLVLSRRTHKYVFPGSSVAKIVGREPLPYRTGLLLED